MSIHLHNHSILDHSITSRPLIFGQLVLQAAFKYLPIGTESTFVLPQWAINSVEGVLFGVSQPLFDRYIMYTPIRRGSGINNVLRASMALVGIAYGVRKMEWANPMQISLMWSALNIILWGYLDTTASGFILSSIIAAVVMLILGVDHGKLAQYLWLASFYFCGAIIFGQVGRFFYR
ncbi:hypothetical protein BABINDRAFT_39777 [Babjeviella inositovora NRRL Y-12698]|uniref:Uncharacterized protein n=1 Tax=Babjeviella inositovora NRRL Y-12698 TaxID=984486 RepID=A0A1E3QMG4_9ASCO|nr:uncharacterized protein BABINDRAFT_39777 [Babjeviella inositovora NRRL Y-12698]ODQ78177.1 hypothetical protein BABINDRAFT_39777 [Babjeviella inositovora NRRL Y-12698]